MGGICRFAEQITTFSWLGGAPNHFVIIPTDCSASLSQSCNHSDSAASLRETASSSCLAIIKKVATVSCKHGRLPPFSNLVSSSPALSHAQNRPIGLTRCFAAILLMRRRSFLAQPSEKTCKHVLFWTRARMSCFITSFRPCLRLLVLPGFLL